jgi:hypothetical protein|tara:strand:+ start:63 stop:398 length:336 start_codon:yes stop_codon:yes gene_type:complete
MIDKVARAICKSDYDNNSNRWKWEELGSIGMAKYYELAKDAIEAMREPSDRYAAHDTVVWSDGPDADITLTQLCEAWPESDKHPQYPNPKNVQARIYRAMIDKALEGKKDL